MDKKYAGMVQKYSEIMPPVLRRQIRYKQAQLADEEFKTKFEQQREDKLVDEPTKRHETDVLEFSNDHCQQMFEDQDDEGNDTAFKDVIRLFREPNSRLYLPKEAYVRINFVQIKKDTDEEILHCFGEMQKIDISKYVDSVDEPVSFMFKPDQSQLAEIPNLPVLVKIDAELSVRPSDSELTTANEYDDKGEAEWEKAELEKAYTLSVENFKGEDPILKACKEFPELKDQTDRDVALEIVENDKELRKAVCEKHQLIRYTLEGMGFEFPPDEEMHIKDPENIQIWNQFENQFNRVTDKIAQQEEAIDVTMSEVSSSAKVINKLSGEYKAFLDKEAAAEKKAAAFKMDPIYDDYAAF